MLIEPQQVGLFISIVLSIVSMTIIWLSEYSHRRASKDTSGPYYGS